ncbi:MAG TPA: hypothetical protein VFF33_02420 [Ignavibacteriaceae bacterium]|nr:hypothetical protein [Ignavibacteriaceae bacterium]
MKIILVLFSLFLSLLIVSCSNDNTITPSDNSSGNITLAFDKTTIPPNVAYIKVLLTKAGHTPVTGTMDLTSDSTAELTLSNLIVGEWLLKVAAFGSANDTLYIGETNVNIIENYTSVVNLTLNPVPAGSGYGHVKIYVRWAGQQIPPITDWQDYGLIMSGGLYGQTNGVHDACVRYENGVYKMWYSGINNSAVGHIFYATSIDGINWVKRTEPILSPTFNTWFSHAISTPKVIKVDNVYRMYFAGFENQNSTWNIGIASSMDGINWEVTSTPIMYGTYGDKFQLIPGDVVYQNNKYYLYYLGRSPEGMGWKQKIYLATSTDGFNFSINNTPIISATYGWESNYIFQPTVIYDVDKFKMVYVDYENTKCLGYAESIDGITWEKSPEPIFNAYHLKNHWATNIFTVNFRNIEGQYKIFYANNLYKMGLLNKQL